MAAEVRADRHLLTDRETVILHRRQTAFWKALIGIAGVLAALLLLAMIWMAAVHALAEVAKMLA